MEKHLLRPKKHVSSGLMYFLIASFFITKAPAFFVEICAFPVIPDSSIVDNSGQTSC